jgi:hypothetical protein
MHRLAATAIVTAVALSGCTIGGALTGAGIAASHNHFVDHSADKWSDGGAALIGAGVGLVVDILLLKALGDAWSKPMT